MDLHTIDKRLDKIETKLDEHLKISATNTADISWIKGFIKYTKGLLAALVVGTVSSLFKVFSNQ